MNEEAFEVLEAIMRERCTEKVLGEVGEATLMPESLEATHRERVLRALKAAGMAPFHYQRNVEGLAEPWRAHILWQASVQKLALELRDTWQLKSKEPKLAAACSALVLVTWLPEFYEPVQQERTKLERPAQVARDEEHLAAASAMVQNLLLLLTASGMGTYWSSGGKLREKEVLQSLGVPGQERLLAAVFIEYPEFKERPLERKAGAHRKHRSEQWWREVTL